MRLANEPMRDSPVMLKIKSGLRGNGNWPGWSEVYEKISKACDLMGNDNSARLGENHVDAMADLGSGHEERMKYRLMWLRQYGWIK